MVNRKLDNARHEEELYYERKLEAVLQSDKCYTCGLQAKMSSACRCICDNTFHPACECTEVQLASWTGSAEKSRPCRGKKDLSRVPTPNADQIPRKQMSIFQAQLYPLPCPCGAQRPDIQIACVRCNKSWHLSCAKNYLNFCSGQFVCAVCVDKEQSAAHARVPRSYRFAGFNSPL